MRLLYFSDPHFSAVGPISRIDDYQESMLRKLYEILGIAKEYSIDAILCGGDFFHLKSWMRNPYELTNRLIDAFNSMPCKTWGIFGDHDVPGRNEGSLERQPLMTLCKLTNLGLLSKGEFWGHSTVLSGAPKTDNYESDLTNYIPVFGGSQDENTIRIHMSHGDLYVKRPAYEPYTLYSQLSGSHIDFHFNGHVHDDLGEVKVGKTIIINRGALSRGSLVESNLNRKVMVTLLDTEKKVLKYIELKSALPANKIFDLDRVKETRQAEIEMMKLGELIRHEAGSVELSGPESIRHLVRELKTISEPVRTTIFQLLDKADEFQ